MKKLFLIIGILLLGYIDVAFIRGLVLQYRTFADILISCIAIAICTFFIRKLFKCLFATSSSIILHNPITINTISRHNNHSSYVNSPIEGKRIVIAGVSVMLTGNRIIDLESDCVIHPQKLNYLKTSAKMRIPQRFRIATDCVNLLQKTNNPDVFFMRYNLMIESLQELVFYHIVFGIPPDDPSNTLEAAMLNRISITCEFIEKSHYNMIVEAEKLKTSRGRHNRHLDYYQKLKPYIASEPLVIMELIERLMEEDHILSDEL